MTKRRKREKSARASGAVMCCKIYLGDCSIIALTLALAAVGRLLLAAHGWPGVESDESIVGLMTDDIVRHGAHPVFFSGQNYIGALQAYLAVPFFLLLGATPFALLVTATTETILCFLILYLFTRTVFSHAVALVTLLLLAAGPFTALRAELHVGAGEHDTLLLGALILWLVTLRLRGHGGLRTHLALDAGAGLVVGLALWGDLLILPFALTAALALMLRTAWRLLARHELARRERALRIDRIRLGAEAGVATTFFLIGLAPLLIANVASGGATFREIFGAANAQNAQFTPPLPPGLAGSVWALWLQIVATLLVGLPHALGNTVVCGSCATWPLATAGVPITALIWSGVVSLGFSLFAVLCWTLAAVPLARDVLGDARRLLMARPGTTALPRARRAGEYYDARWWGRALLVVGALGTVAQYVVSRAAYLYPVTSARYLVGLYLCAPLVAAPLVTGLQAGWRWGASGGLRPSIQTTRLPPLSAVGATILLVILIALTLGGWRRAFAEASDSAAFGQPTGQRQVVVIAYLREQQITRFYTDYWTCYQLVFATDQRLACAVFDDEHVFGRGTTRLEAMSDLVAATPHAPYVFDLSSAQPRARAAEFAAAIAQRDPRVTGYRVTHVGTYDVYVCPRDACAGSAAPPVNRSWCARHTRWTATSSAAPAPAGRSQPTVRDVIADFDAAHPNRPILYLIKVRHPVEWSSLVVLASQCAWSHLRIDGITAEEVKLSILLGSRHGAPMTSSR